jgi:hypothetical protein
MIDTHVLNPARRAYTAQPMGHEGLRGALDYRETQTMADPASALTLPVAIVQLVGQLGWPVAVLIVVYRFHRHIESLLSSLASIKFGRLSGT